ncbi:MAG: adenylyl-sulfate kinase [Fibromonadales bacterium]|nr:adenylyl-sulfate kinase [Fibromonadales bacterium]
MTGISGSGKTTLANAVTERLRERSISIDVIDGDETRQLIGEIFGHSKEERQKMSRINQTIGRYLLRNNVSFILAVVAPFEKIRMQFRNFFGDAYIEIYVRASAEICAKRDVKGLYKLNQEGKIVHLNGSDATFEVPENSDLIIDTDNTSIAKCCADIIEYLHNEGYIEW